MRILFVVTSTDLGGAENALAELAASLHKEHEVQILSLKPLGSVGRRLCRDGIAVHSLSMNRYNQFLIPLRIRQTIRSFQPDLVHAMLFRAIEYTRLACFGLSVPLVTTPHYDLSKKHFLCRSIDRLLRELDTISMAESVSTERYLTKAQKYAQHKVYLMVNGVDKTVFFKDLSLRTAMREKYALLENQVVFISVARLFPVKDPFIQVQAFRNLLRTHPQAKLFLVGEGPQRGLLENFIKQNGMQGSVFLVGEQSRVNDWLNMADVFILSSTEESLPLSLLEALAVGLPCIVSHVGDMPLWVEHGKNGFIFNPKDITVLSCFMAEMMNPSVRAQMGRASLALAANIQASFQQHQQVYQQILTNSFHVKTKIRP